MNNNKNSCKGFLNILNEFIIKNYKKFYITMGNGKNKNKKKIEKRLYSIFTKAFIFIAIIFLIEILFVLGFLIFEKDHNPQSILDLLGPFGDFFGGMLNPILTFCTFMALLMTIILQQRELKLSREQVAISVKELGETRKATEISSQALTEQSKSLQIQNFENTFFNMINLHNEIVNNLKIQNHYIEYDYIETNDYIKDNYGAIPKRYINTNFSLIKTFQINNQMLIGREVIEIICNNFNSFIKDRNYEKTKDNSIFREYNNFHKINNINNYRKPTLIYDLCHQCYSNIIGHYFGNIYQILKFISTSKDINLDKRKYSDLFRAQFSSQELQLLFYHCSASIGSKKFKVYLEEFEFLEHLNIQEENIFFKYIFYNSIYENKAFGEKNNEEIEKIKNKIKRQIEQLVNKVNEDERYLHLDLYKYFSKTTIENCLQMLKENSTSSSNSISKNLALIDYSIEDNAKKYSFTKEI